MACLVREVETVTGDYVEGTKKKKKRRKQFLNFKEMTYTGGDGNSSKLQENSST